MVRKFNFRERTFLRVEELLSDQVRLRYSGKFKVPKKGLMYLKKGLRDPRKVNGPKEVIFKP